MKIDDLMETIRKRNRKEWSEYARDRWIKSRIWVQEHGEQAAILALVLGILLVLAFRLILSLLILAVILAGAVYLLADPVEVAQNKITPAEKKMEEKDEGSE